MTKPLSSFLISTRTIKWLECMIEYPADKEMKPNNPLKSTLMNRKMQGMLVGTLQRDAHEWMENS
jgi:hypothetical protein